MGGAHDCTAMRSEEDIRFPRTVEVKGLTPKVSHEGLPEHHSPLTISQDGHRQMRDRIPYPKR